MVHFFGKVAQMEKCPKKERNAAVVRSSIGTLPAADIGAGEIIDPGSLLTNENLRR